MVHTVILLPLHPASLMHKNPQRCKIIEHSMHPVRTQKEIDQFEYFWVECAVCAISVAAVYSCIFILVLFK